VTYVELIFMRPSHLSIYDSRLDDLRAGGADDDGGGQGTSGGDLLRGRIPRLRRHSIKDIKPLF